MAEETFTPWVRYIGHGSPTVWGGQRYGPLYVATCTCGWEDHERMSKPNAQSVAYRHWRTEHP